MSDLISRRAAIDAVKHAWAKGLEPTQYLEELPSTQPEQRWIPCSERLPEDGKEVLVTDGENMMVAYYRNDAEAWDNYNFGWVEGRNEEMPYGINKVIAWMPLPEPYRGRGKG